MEVLDIVLYSLIAAAVLLLIFGLAVANFAGENLIVEYNKYEKYIVPYTNTLNFAQTISNGEFNGQIQCEVVEGFLTDHYSKGKIHLSQRVAHSSNVSGFAVCAHELGHAIQFRDNREKLKKFISRQRFSKVTSKLTFPFFLFGIIAIFFNIYASIALFGVGVFAFLFGLFAKLSTISIEKEASDNAIKLLEKYGEFDENMIRAAKKVLKAAKLTYIASFLKSMLAFTMLTRKYDFY